MKNLIFFLSLFLFGCYNEDEKEPKIRQVKGHVVSKETFLPLPNIKMYLFFNGNESRTPVETLLTDKDGKYEFNFLSYGTWDHSIGIEKEPFFSRWINDGYLGINQSATIYLSPMSFMKVNIKNTQPFDDNDKIIIPAVNNEGFIGSKVTETKIVSSVYDNGHKQSLLYYVKKNDTIQTFNIPIKLTSFDTTVVDINY